MKKNPNKTLLKQKNNFLINEYYHWLCDLINVNTSETSYYFLANDLHKREFYWSVPNDDNRANDGIKLRDLFLEEENYKDETIKGPCTVLEMLIGLAIKIDSIMADLKNTNQTSKWFWMMMSNIGLDKFNDDIFFDINGEKNINLIIDTLLDRTYMPNGKKGLFPMKFNTTDQRKIEIWYQMSEYILENYYLKEEIMC